MAGLIVFNPGHLQAYPGEKTDWQRVIISEVMVLPDLPSPKLGQWIELTNPGSQEVNLQGLVIATKSGGFHVVSPSKPLILPPKGHVVLARTPQVEVNGGVEPLYTFGGEVELDQTSDVIVVSKGGKVVDVFAYGEEVLPVHEGHTFSLEPPTGGALYEKHWCYGRTPYGEGLNFGTPGAENPFCDNDGDGFAEDEGDCNDTDPALNPKGVEVCNGLDDNCDGRTDDVGPPEDFSCPSKGVCASLTPICAGPWGWICPFPPDYEEVEFSCDGLDNDCDGETDEDLTPPFGCLSEGVCRGTVPLCEGPLGFRCPYPPTYEEVEVTCDGLDNDCDGLTDEEWPVGEPCDSQDSDLCPFGTFRCKADGSGVECVEEIRTDIVERCNGLDDDCDGETDEGFPVGKTCEVGLGACRQIGKWRCSSDGSGVVCSAVPSEPGPEVCANLIDDDCDGLTDEDECLAPKSGDGCSASLPWAQTFWPQALLLTIILIGSARVARKGDQGRRHKGG